MRLPTLLSTVSLTVVLGTGCAAAIEAAPESEEGQTDTQALAASKVRLPAGDPCRDVLGPLALGLADGAVGLAYTKGIAVSLTSETETRTYTVEIAHAGNAFRYEVELDNDSHSMCFLEGIKLDPSAKLAGDARKMATGKELHPVSAKITVSPAKDDCASTVKLLAEAIASSTVGASQVIAVKATLESETEDRDYGVHVDGKAFVANGTRFPNDADYAIQLSNDSAFKCLVQEIHAR